jgi:hypothetical protein
VLGVEEGLEDDSVDAAGFDSLAGLDSDLDSDCDSDLESSDVVEDGTELDWDSLLGDGREA